MSTHKELKVKVLLKAIRLCTMQLILMRLLLRLLLCS